MNLRLIITGILLFISSINYCQLIYTGLGEKNGWEKNHLNGKVESFTLKTNTTKKRLGFKIKKNNSSFHCKKEFDDLIQFDTNGLVIGLSSCYCSLEKKIIEDSKLLFNDENEIIGHVLNISNFGTFKDITIKDSFDKDITYRYVNDSLTETEFTICDSANKTITCKTYVNNSLSMISIKKYTKNNNTVITYHIENKDTTSRRVEAFDSLDREIKGISYADGKVNHGFIYEYSSDKKYNYYKVTELRYPEKELYISYIDSIKNCQVDSLIILDSTDNFIRVDRVVHSKINNPLYCYQITHYYENGKVSVYTYKYLFDKNKNWVKMKKKLNGEVVSITKRKIKYFK